MSDLFVDRLGNVAIADGVVRLDFLRLVSVDPEKKQVQMEPSVRVAIPLPGLPAGHRDARQGARRTAAPGATRPRSRPRIHPFRFLLLTAGPGRLSRP